MNVCQYLIASCIDCLNYFIPAPVQLSSNLTIERIDSVAVCILREASITEIYDVESMYLKASISTDSLDKEIDSSETTANPIEESRFVESPMMLEKHESFSIVDRTDSKQILQNEHLANKSLLKKRKEKGQLLPKAHLLSSTIPSVVASQITSLHIERVCRRSCGSPISNTFDFISLEQRGLDLENNTAFYPVINHPYYSYTVFEPRAMALYHQQ
ncbi:MAG: hypothetical protein FJZ57_01655 [Chlamydiae bacterium]|nr:hypothetical protein [Chlamydiota bacterium]